MSEGALQGARGSPCRALNRAPPEAGAEATWGRVLVLRQTCRAGICPPEFTQAPLTTRLQGERPQPRPEP